MMPAAAGRHSCVPVCPAGRRCMQRPAAGLRSWAPADRRSIPVCLTGRAPWTTYGFPIRASGVWSLDRNQQDRSLRRSNRPRWRKVGGGQRSPAFLPAPDGYTPARPAPKRSARRSKLDLCSFWWIGSPVLIPTPCCMLKSQARTSQKRLPRMKDRLTGGHAHSAARVEKLGTDYSAAVSVEIR